MKNKDFYIIEVHDVLFGEKTVLDFTEDIYVNDEEINAFDTEEIEKIVNILTGDSESNKIEDIDEFIEEITKGYNKKIDYARKHLIEDDNEDFVEDVIDDYDVIVIYKNNDKIYSTDIKFNETHEINSLKDCKHLTDNLTDKQIDNLEDIEKDIQS